MADDVRIRYMTKQEASVYQGRQSDWLNPLAMKMLKEALLKKKGDVVLNGTKYWITYGYRRTYPVSKETIESIKLTRVDGTFVPMGFVEVRKILAYEFEGE